MSTRSPTNLTTPPTQLPDPSEFLSLARAARLLQPGRGRQTHPSTLYRWSTVGVIADDGAHVRLKTAQLGRLTVTTRRWLSEFAEELTARRDSARAAADPATAAERRRARDAQTRAVLERAGIIKPGGQ